MQSPQAAAAVPELPQDIWKLILEHVPLAERLGSCSLVSRNLAAAAVAATHTLSVKLRNKPGMVAGCMQCNMQYLQHHGRHLTSLRLSTSRIPRPVIEQLPCALKELHLEYCEVKLASAFAACTGLTHLDMAGCCSPLFSTGRLACLSALVKLQHVDICSFSSKSVFFTFSGLRGESYGRATFPGSILPALTQLTYLRICEVGLEGLSHLSHLRVLDVLHLNWCGDVHIGQGMLPTSLRHLWLGFDVQLDPTTLSPHTQLTALHLNGVRFATHTAGSASGSALLSALANLKQLQELELSDIYNVAWPPPGAEYTAFRASSKLQGLSVLIYDWPCGVWEHVFPGPAPRSLTALRSLVAACTCDDYYTDSDSDFEEDYQPRPSVIWSGPAVSALVSCCPALEQVSLALHSNSPASSLQHLSALTELTLVVGRGPDDEPLQADVFRCVAKMSALERLCLDLWGLLPLTTSTLSTLRPLTALRGLTELHCLPEARPLRRFVDKAPADKPPNVWQQLLNACQYELDSSTSQSDL